MQKKSLSHHACKLREKIFASVDNANVKIFLFLTLFCENTIQKKIEKKTLNNWENLIRLQKCHKKLQNVMHT